ncbi:ATP-binding protein [Nonomuraea soli]|uniref:Anti-sigma regulatory factor (Ser/Thr protein kinase) n=1 Tax=Nonomuraea soli TaxID=1032476 RepID=A0A7W0HNS3_9ACTN|nr:ATP-binding protein [Nonomuraea soli]MBA2890093.1 anti-sigma regulatory factor (Ser/Thr protein kinase) [Nonomuraea soli]
MQDTGLLQPSGPAGEAVARFTLARLSSVRAFAADSARSFGMKASALPDVLIAINEIVTNAVTHGQEPAQVRMWREADDLVVEVHDGGRWTDAAQLSDRPPDLPADTSPGGRGLWIARAVADLVMVGTGDTGTRVTLRFTLA